MRNLYLIRGLPGSGKSTLARALVRSLGGEHYEADDYFLDESGNYNFIGEELPMAHFACYAGVKGAMLREVENIAVSNTFTLLRELDSYFYWAKEFGYTVTVILTQGNFINIHNVPAATLEKMRTRFEYDVSSLYRKYEE